MIPQIRPNGRDTDPIETAIVMLTNKAPHKMNTIGPVCCFNDTFPIEKHAR